MSPYRKAFFLIMGYRITKAYQSNNFLRPFPTPTQGNPTTTPLPGGSEATYPQDSPSRGCNLDSVPGLRMPSVVTPYNQLPAIGLGRFIALPTSEIPSIWRKYILISRHTYDKTYIIYLFLADWGTVVGAIMPPRLAIGLNNPNFPRIHLTIQSTLSNAELAF